MARIKYFPSCFSHFTVLIYYYPTFAANYVLHIQQIVIEIQIVPISREAQQSHIMLTHISMKSTRICPLRTDWEGGRRLSWPLRPLTWERLNKQQTLKKNRASMHLYLWALKSYRPFCKRYRYVYLTHARLHSLRSTSNLLSEPL